MYCRISMLLFILSNQCNHPQALIPISKKTVKSISLFSRKCCPTIRCLLDSGSKTWSSDSLLWSVSLLLFRAIAQCNQDCRACHHYRWHPRAILRSTQNYEFVSIAWPRPQGTSAFFGGLRWPWASGHVGHSGSDGAESEISRASDNASRESRN